VENSVTSACSHAESTRSYFVTGGEAPAGLSSTGRSPSGTPRPWPSQWRGPRTPAGCPAAEPGIPATAQRPSRCQMPPAPGWAAVHPQAPDRGPLMSRPACRRPRTIGDLPAPRADPAELHRGSLPSASAAPAGCESSRYRGSRPNHQERDPNQWKKPEQVTPPPGHAGARPAEPVRPRPPMVPRRDP